jgi:hypothetical protein
MTVAAASFEYGSLLREDKRMIYLSPTGYSDVTAKRTEQQ